MQPAALTCFGMPVDVGPAINVVKSRRRLSSGLKTPTMISMGENVKYKNLT